MYLIIYRYNSSINFLQITIILNLPLSIYNQNIKFQFKILELPLTQYKQLFEI